jgi:hypothetical protein
LKVIGRTSLLTIFSTLGNSILRDKEKRFINEKALHHIIR